MDNAEISNRYIQHCSNIKKNDVSNVAKFDSDLL